ncbi:MAG: 4Fe-4S dicluster domain-containing protein [Clostridiales Family XIII bacterium]|jgi:2-oxoglutarate ferredoxin oxidoreductase subunit delta|nr:4Fe-4S dicluster domain-containing protein [Clostridiales Family XIII bacterium]
MAKVEITAAYCKGCLLCEALCPKGVLSLGNEVNALGYNIIKADDTKECIACQQCAVICPEGAIEVYK